MTHCSKNWDITAVGWEDCSLLLQTSIEEVSRIAGAAEMYT